MYLYYITYLPYIIYYCYLYNILYNIWCHSSRVNLPFIPQMTIEEEVTALWDVVWSNAGHVFLARKSSCNHSYRGGHGGGWAVHSKQNRNRRVHPNSMAGLRSILCRTRPQNAATISYPDESVSSDSLCESVLFLFSVYRGLQSSEFSWTA